jgi:hypothetical protein
MQPLPVEVTSLPAHLLQLLCVAVNQAGQLLLQLLAAMLRST